MKKFFQVLGIIVLVAVAMAYLCFLFLLPNIIDLNKYKSLIKDTVKETSNIDLTLGDIKLITTPFLGAGIKVDGVRANLPDGSLLLSTEELKTRIAVPSLFLLTLKVSCLELKNPLINLEIAEDNVDYKVIKLVEDILNEKREKTLGEEKVVTETWFNPKWIRIKVPCARLHNYKIIVTELKTGHKLDLHGEELKAGYFNKKTAKLKTYAELYSDENKNLSANIDVNTFLPQKEPKLDSEDDPAERIDIRFVNPVELYRTYNLKADIDAKIKIRKNEDDLTSYGHINIDGITMKVSQLQLPESYIHLKTLKHTLDIDTNIYAAPEQNIQLLGKLNYSNHPWLNMNIKTGKIQYNDMLILGKAFLDSLRIPNELGQYKAEGSSIADCHIKTNFKKLNSRGYIKVKDGGLAVRNVGQVISRANINANLEDSALAFNDSSMYINQSKISIDGNIDKHSVADIKIKTDKLPLPSLFYTFAPKQIRQAYNFRAADFTMDAAIKGKLKEVVAFAEVGLNNFDLSDKKNSFNIRDGRLSGEFTFEAKQNALSGHINNNDFSISIPKTSSVIKIPVLEVGLADKNISIPENKLYFNNNSVIKFNGDVLNYEKLKNISFNAAGNISTEDLVKLLGQQLKPYIHYQGVIPVKLTINGSKKKQTVVAQALADKDNFITPADFTELGGKQTSLQAVADLKPGRIKVKKTGLYVRTTSVDEEGNEVVHLDDIIDIDGTIAGKRINLLKINMPKILSGKICIFPQSSFVVDKFKLFAYGATSNPIIRGVINIREIKIPEILTSLDNVKLDFKGHALDFGLNNVVLNKSDINASGTIDLNPSSKINISGLDVSSKDIKLENLMEVLNLVMKYMPAQSNTGSASSGSNKDIPVNIQSGTVNMRKISTGNIEVFNTASRIALRQNILGLRNLRTNIFKGQVNGDIFVDLIKTVVNVDLSGNGIDVEKALFDSAGMKNMLTGTAKFDAKLSIDGNAKTQAEQIKGIEGDINFAVSNGQFGPFGKIENLIIAENIRESQFFQTALGGVINSLTSIDTTHFSELKGSLKLEKGVCHINPITSLGNILSMHIFGDFDIIRNYADMKVRAKMSSVISNLLGPLNAINPINLMNSAASLNVVTAKAFSIFCEVVPKEEFEIIPNFSNGYVDASATKFQLGVRGDASKPLTLIKSFKWLASKTDYDNAIEYVNSLPEEIEGSTATNIEEAIAEAKALEAEKKTLKYKLKHMFAKENAKNDVKTEKSDEKDNEEISVEENFADDEMTNTENSIQE